MIEYLIAFFTAMGGILMGTVLNYYVLRRLFKREKTSIAEIITQTKEVKELAEFIHMLNDFSHSPEAKEMVRNIRTFLRRIGSVKTTDE